MHLVYVTPRYGTEIIGGAESAVRSFAIRTAARGHKVAVITSTARGLDWDNSTNAGTTIEDGVVVHRLPPLHPRLPDFATKYAQLAATGRLLGGASAYDQFLADQGPVLEGFDGLLTELDPDRVISYPMLYWPNLRALLWKPARAVLHPAAHPEPLAGAAPYQRLVPLARRIVFQTTSEQQLLNRLMKIAASRQLVLPLGIDLLDTHTHTTAAGQNPSSSRPYAVSLGRVQADKGTNLLAELYRVARPSLDLKIAGPIVEAPEPAPGVEVLGPISDQERSALLANARAVIIASRYESFSLVAAEAMVLGIPLIINGFNQVLTEQIENSGGGLAVRSATELLGAIELLARDDALAHMLGSNGRQYAEQHYHWDQVIDRYLAFLEKPV